MIVSHILIIFAGTIFHSESLFVDTVAKCSVKDQECQKNVYMLVVKQYAKSGIPELGVAPIDPAKLNNITITVLNILNITVFDGMVNGIRDCLFNKFTCDFENDVSEMNVTCDMNIEGKYKVEASNPEIESLFGKKFIHGEGNGKIEIDKINFIFKFPFHFEKSSNGELHLKFKANHDFKVLGHVKFHVDMLYVGDQEVSERIVKFLNENWEHYMTRFGMVFTKEAMEIFHKHISKIFDVVPAKHFFIEDLTQFVKKT